MRVTARRGSSVTSPIVVLRAVTVARGQRVRSAQAVTQAVPHAAAAGRVHGPAPAAHPAVGLGDLQRAVDGRRRRVAVEVGQHLQRGVRGHRGREHRRRTQRRAAGRRRSAGRRRWARPGRGRRGAGRGSAGRTSGRAAPAGRRRRWSPAPARTGAGSRPAAAGRAGRRGPAPARRRARRGRAGPAAPAAWLRRPTAPTRRAARMRGVRRRLRRRPRQLGAGGRDVGRPARCPRRRRPACPTPAAASSVTTDGADPAGAAHGHDAGPPAGQHRDAAVSRAVRSSEAAARSGASRSRSRPAQRGQRPAVGGGVLEHAGALRAARAARLPAPASTPSRWAVLSTSLRSRVPSSALDAAGRSPGRGR